MLQPTGKDDASPKMLDPTHTHLVRGGSLMLRSQQAAALVCRLQHQGPTSYEVGMREI